LKIAPLQSFFFGFPPFPLLDARNFNFLNRLNKITDVKSALKGGNQKKKLCKGAIFKKFLAGG
jgi:hypothetical protein